MNDEKRPVPVVRTPTAGFQIPQYQHETTGGVAHANAAVRKKFKKVILDWLMYSNCLAVSNIRAVQRPRQNSVPYAGSIAAEPGLDYTTLDVEGFDASAEVTVTDYSFERYNVSRMDNLEDLQKFFADDRPLWAKVRWINVHGLNWKYIKFLASTYNLHRLAIEDLLSVQRTKADWYQDRIQLLYLKLIAQIFMSVC
jgi:hypothetical protein